MGYRVYIVVTNMKTRKTHRRFKGEEYKTLEEAQQYMKRCILKTGKFHNILEVEENA
jgi:hypothetical protein